MPEPDATKHLAIPADAPATGRLAGEPSARKSWFTTLAGAVERVVKVVSGTAVIATGAVLLLALFLDLRQDRVVVDPFLVSSDVDVLKGGSENAALAQRYSGQLRDVVVEARSNYPAALAESAAADERFEAPGEYAVFTKAVRYVAEAIGTKVTHVQGQLVLHAEDNAALTVRVIAPRLGHDSSFTETGTIGELDAMLQRSATKAMVKIAPVTAAVYLHGKQKVSADVIKVAQEMLQDGPVAANDHAWAYTLWGFARLGERDYTGAERLLLQALEHDKWFPLAHYNLGIAYQELAKSSKSDGTAEKRYAEAAIRAYHLGSQGSSRALRARALFNQSQTLMLLKRNLEALAAVRGAIDAFPYFPQAFWFQGQVLASLNRMDEATVWYKRAIAENADGAQATTACIDFGLALWRAKRIPQAIDAFGKCLALSPNDAQKIELNQHVAMLTPFAHKKE